MCNAQKFGIAGIIIGAISIVHSLYLQTKIKKTHDMLDKAVDSMAKGIPVNVPEELVERAVDIAVGYEVQKSVRIASTNVVNGVRDDIKNEVKKAVDATYTDIRKSVSDEIAKQVSNLDIGRLKAEVKEKAKEIVIEKFNDNLDSTLDDFNQNLSNVRKIYDSIADSVTKKPDQVFKIGG